MFQEFGLAAGSGQKSAVTLAYQSSRRGQIEEIVTAAEWDRVIRGVLKQAKRGNVKAAAWLAPWVMGAEPKEVTVHVEARVRAFALAAGIDPEVAVAEAERILALVGGDT
ncbi:MAG TPA: hypothetical protein VKD21_04435 [Acidimicrobiales bacterium]|nr:hypothetical protein [Acidimicrobiales bacterium]